MSTNTFHAGLLPWFAMGHINAFLLLSNKLAGRGHRISFFVPNKAQEKVQHLNHYPNLIKFIPLTVPRIDGLSVGAETLSDLCAHQGNLLAQAFDQTQDQVQTALLSTKPDFMFFDFANWLPTLCNQVGTKCIFFSVSSVGSSAWALVPQEKWVEVNELELIPKPCYPKATLAKDYSGCTDGDEGRVSLVERILQSMDGSAAFCFGSCNEVEGPIIDYLVNQCTKLLLVMGPNLPGPINSPLDEKWASWLGGFTQGSVVYCAFGSECVMEMSQFQELVLGLELSGFPFLVRLKPPVGCQTVEEALPVGFAERVRGRGVVEGGWIQQQHILNHPSVGCIVSHCGFVSMWESLVSNCQIVLIPQFGDQFFSAKLMTSMLKVAVEVERREEDGWFTKESACHAVKTVMDDECEIGAEVRANHQKCRDLLLADGLESSYFNTFIRKLQALLE